MSSKLFAFQVAKPIESGVHETLYTEYDPESQTLIWQGGTRPQAVWCSNYAAWNARPNCNAYGDYCTTWGPIIAPNIGYSCDGL